MKGLECILNQNRLAIASIESSDYAVAVSILSAAVRDYKQVIMKHNFPNESKDQAWLALDDCVAQPIHSVTSADLIGDSFVRFTSAIDLTTVGMKDASRNGSVVISAVLMFNLALAYNLSGELSKAIQLYGLAVRMSHEERSRGLLFTMTCINNAAVAYTDLGDDESADRYFESLLSILMCLVDNEEQFQVAHGTSVLLEGFFQNTSYLILGPRNFAPAA